MHRFGARTEPYRVFSDADGGARAAQGRLSGSCRPSPVRAADCRAQGDRIPPILERTAGVVGAPRPAARVRIAGHDRCRTVVVLVTGATGFTGGHWRARSRRRAPACARWCAIRERRQPALDPMTAISTGPASRIDVVLRRSARPGGGRPGGAGRRGRLQHRGDVPTGRALDRNLSSRQRRRRRRPRRAGGARRRSPRRALQHGRRARRHRTSAGERGRAAQAGRCLSAHEGRGRRAGAGCRGAVRHRGDDCQAERHLRSWRPSTPEAVPQHRAPLSDAGPRRNLLPSHLHRRSGRGLSTLRRASGGGQPHLHPGRP